MKMKPLLLAAALAAATCPLQALMDEAEFAELETRIEALQEAGELAQAERLTEKILQEAHRLSAEQIRTMEWEAERTRRIRRDYRLTEERLIELLDGRLEDFSREEYEAWLEEGRFDTKTIDGERRFVGATVANLMFRHPQLRERDTREYTGNWDRFLWNAYETAMARRNEFSTDLSGSERFRVTFTITVNADEVPAGETIRVWMPYPQQFKAQGNVTLHRAEPAPVYINAPDYPQRSIYFEAPSNGDEPTVFTAEYSFETFARWNPVDIDRVLPSSAETFPEFEYFTSEQPPHVTFTPEIRALAEEIVGTETNPYLKAKAIYEWMSDNVQYSFAREYSTLRNIAQYVCDARYGDCGQLALLYIALCRAAGVPARWQSGWTMYPAAPNLHDWAEIYVAPYGWIPVDVNYGIFATQRLFALSDEQRATLREYYFGGLDAFRMTVNRDHGYPHYPPKEDFRSDTVDFQRGEVEAGGENLYYGRFRYNLRLDYDDQASEGAAMQGGVGSD